MLQATDQMIQTQQITRISRDLDGFNTQKSSRSMVLTIINKDELSANNLGLAKAKKWMAKIFDVFDDEIPIHQPRSNGTFRFNMFFVYYRWTVEKLILMSLK